MEKKDKKSRFSISFDKGKLRKELGIFLVDIAKLVFGGAVLGVILGADYDQSLVVGLGILSVLALALFGMVLQAQTTDDKEK